MANIHSQIQLIPNTITYIDNADANNIYIGYAAPGTTTSASDWQIRKVATSGGQVIITFASDSPAYNKIWDNRASYSY